MIREFVLPGGVEVIKGESVKPVSWAGNPAQGAHELLVSLA